MSNSNLERARAYLDAAASLGPASGVSAFYAPNVEIREFPNRIAPMGRIRRIEHVGAAYEAGRGILRSQNYAIRHAIESGNEVVMEIEWTGVLAKPVLGLPEGFEMRAFVAMFLAFDDDGLIVSQRNYDCYRLLK
jgi:hypothetical protein